MTASMGKKKFFPLLKYFSITVFFVLHQHLEFGATQRISPEAKTRIINTKYGKLQGVTVRVGRDAQEKRFVQIFRGVPYASPPIGNHRFSPTRPPTHWTGVREAFQPGPACPQAFPQDLTNSSAVLSRMPKSRRDFLYKVQRRLIDQSEDCLNLNIFVPASRQNGGSNGANKNNNNEDESGTQGLGVILFIHGESFSWGSGNLYDGRVLASYGKVIVVTLNYRLGIFGFLNTNVSPSQKPRMANYGLMDQIAALKWIQENIGYFGGDPGAVTVMGHHAGAAAVHLLLHSPVVVPNLFHRVILMSGSAYAPWALVDDPVHYAVKLASHLDCKIPRNMLHHNEELLDCLRNKSVPELLSFSLASPTFLTAVGPSKDGILIPNDFPPEDFVDALRTDPPRPKRQKSEAEIENDFWPAKTISKKFQRGANNYQVMIGLTEDETDIFFSEIQASQGIGPSDRDRYLRTLIRNNYDFHLNEIFAAVQNEYSDFSSFMNGEQEIIRPKFLLKKASQALTDRLYTAPAVKTAQWFQENGHQVYFYVFGEKQGHQMFAKDPNSRFDLLHRFKPLQPRYGHSTMIPLLFGLPFSPELKDENVWEEYDQTTNMDKAVFENAYFKGPMSQQLITYWTNFVKSGNPNKPHTVGDLFRTRARGTTTMPKSGTQNNRRSRTYKQEDGGGFYSSSSYDNSSDMGDYHSPYRVYGGNMQSYGPQKLRRNEEEIFTNRKRNGTISQGLQTRWDFYDPEKQRFIYLALPVEMGHHFRAHELSVWLNLIPKLHRAGANNMFPRQHNILDDDPNTFIGMIRPRVVSHGYQVNRKFLDASTAPASQATKCIPGTVNFSKGSLSLPGSLHEDTSIRWEKASAEAYQKVIYLTIGVGSLLLGINIWFLLCLLFCRRRLKCCYFSEADSTENEGAKSNLMSKQEYVSCDTALVHLAADSLQSDIRESGGHPIQNRDRNRISRSSSLTTDAGASVTTVIPASFSTSSSQPSYEPIETAGGQHNEETLRFLHTVNPVIEEEQSHGRSMSTFSQKSSHCNNHTLLPPNKTHHHHHRRQQQQFYTLPHPQKQ